MIEEDDLIVPDQSLEGVEVDDEAEPADANADHDGPEPDSEVE
jgi:hypothetical protein